MLKKIAYGLLAILLIIQFIRPERNSSDNQSNHIRTVFPIPADVEQTLQVACYDCHSNKTTYPWYANIQPVAWWLAHHVDEGKQHLNFSEFTKRKIAIQNHKLEEVIEMVKEGEMPLNSYTWTHGDAKLSDAQKAAITQWAQAAMDTLKARYPADSLVLRRK